MDLKESLNNLKEATNIATDKMNQMKMILNHPSLSGEMKEELEGMLKDLGVAMTSKNPDLLNKLKEKAELLAKQNKP